MVVSGACLNVAAGVKVYDTTAAGSMSWLNCRWLEFYMDQEVTVVLWSAVSYVHVSGMEHWEIVLC